MVAFSVVLFVFSAISFLRPTGGVEWWTMGIFIGFIVALIAAFNNLGSVLSRKES